MADVRDVDRLVAREGRAVRLTFQVLHEQCGRLGDPHRIEGTHLAVEEIVEEFGADMTVEVAVLELVLEAAQASVARRVAILRTDFHEVERSMEQRLTLSRQLTGEAGAPR